MAPGNSRGESESIIGEWMASRRRREKTVVITKVGSEMGTGARDCQPPISLEPSTSSLQRLRSDYVDIYLSHWPDPSVPYEETLGAFQTLKDAGKVREIGASNLDAAQLQAALDVAREKGLPRYAILQPEYNLYDRERFEGALRDVTVGEGIDVITYFSLAKGSLAGKYRSEADLGSARVVDL